MGLVVGPGRSARLIVARNKLDMTTSGHEAKFRSDKRMSALGLKSGHLSFYEYTP